MASHQRALGKSTGKRADMAYIKIFAIRQRLDKTVAYAANEEKTCLGKLVDYATDPEKTEMRLYESCIK